MFATASVLHGEYGWRVGLPAYAIASWVGASRIEKRRHYLSDVVAGATIGILAGRSVTIGAGPARFAITPLAAPGGVGVSFTRIGKANSPSR
jgi:membrane-associated phospholipid phosphatase